MINERMQQLAGIPLNEAKTQTASMVFVGYDNDELEFNDGKDSWYLDRNSKPAKGLSKRELNNMLGNRFKVVYQKRGISHYALDFWKGQGLTEAKNVRDV